MSGSCSYASLIRMWLSCQLLLGCHVVDELKKGRGGRDDEKVEVSNKQSPTSQEHQADATLKKGARAIKEKARWMVIRGHRPWTGRPRGPTGWKLTGLLGFSGCLGRAFGGVGVLYL